MALTSLKEDLIHEFWAERQMVEDQMELLDPLGTSLRKPAAQRLLHNTTLLLAEFGCYALALAGVVSLFKLSGIYPFSVLNTIYQSNDDLPEKVTTNDVTHFIVAGYAIMIVCIIAVFIIGRMAHTIRLKNGILHQAGKDIKTILGQQLTRQAAIEAIQQRHFLDLPDIVKPAGKSKVNVHEVRNPGYDGEEDEDEGEEEFEE